MKLHYAAASPFVRKVVVAAEELGLTADIGLITLPVTPVAPVAELNEVNPLGKIPALVLDDGTVLYDSRVIVEYLNAIGGGGLVPESGADHWRCRTLEALADGICDAMVVTRYETFLRPEDKRWPEWIRNQLAKAMRGIDRLEVTVDDWAEDLTTGTIAVACALDYADFRFDELGWRNAHPKLAAWHKRFVQRPSMIHSKPD